MKPIEDFANIFLNHFISDFIIWKGNERGLEISHCDIARCLKVCSRRYASTLDIDDAHGDIIVRAAV